MFDQLKDDVAKMSDVSRGEMELQSRQHAQHLYLGELADGNPADIERELDVDVVEERLRLMICLDGQRLEGRGVESDKLQKDLVDADVKLFIELGLGLLIGLLLAVEHLYELVLGTGVPGAGVRLEGQVSHVDPECQRVGVEKGGQQQHGAGEVDVDVDQLGVLHCTRQHGSGGVAPVHHAGGRQPLELGKVGVIDRREEGDDGAEALRRQCDKQRLRGDHDLQRGQGVGGLGVEIDRQKVGHSRTLLVGDDGQRPGVGSGDPVEDRDGGQASIKMEHLVGM